MAFYSVPFYSVTFYSVTFYSVSFWNVADRLLTMITVDILYWVDIY